MSTNRVIGGFEDAFERSQSAVTQGAKQTVKDFTASAKGQLTGGSTSSSSQSHQQSSPSDGVGDQGTNENGSASQSSQQQDPQKSDADRVEFLKDLYGKSDSKSKINQSSAKGSSSVAQVLGIPQNDPNAGKSPEELAQIEALRRQLHSDYYQNLLAAARQKEETITEKHEREEQLEEMEAFEKEKKKPAPLPATVKQGTGESVVGVSG